MHAIRSLERAQSYYGLANQAMYDARRAFECARDGEREARIHFIIGGTYSIPGTLQMLLNDLRNDPILDEPKDIDSAGEGPPDDE
jgi:hypothetical protein